MNMKIPELTAPVRRMWLSRTPQQRKVLVCGSLLMLLALYAWLLQAGTTARSKLQDSVITLRAEAVMLEQQAEEIERLRATPPLAAPESALLPLLQAAVTRAGLAEMLLHSEALDADQVSLAFGAVSFAAWLQWVDDLQALNIRVASARIETLSTPGLVSVTATLLRPGLK